VAKAIEELLQDVVSGLELRLTPRQLEQLATHFALLLRWNQRINLTSVRNPEAIATRHFEESLFLTTLLPSPTGFLVDVGSGAGFPGLAVKIACPSLAAVLLEPNKKKAAFLKEVVRSCGLEGVEVRTGRLEEAARGSLAVRATLVTVRAVKPPQELLADLAKLLAPQGQLALFLGSDAASIGMTAMSWKSSGPISFWPPPPRVV